LLPLLPTCDRLKTSTVARSVPFQKANSWPTWLWPWLYGITEGSGQKPIDTGQRQTWLPQLLAYRSEPVSLSNSFFPFIFFIFRFEPGQERLLLFAGTIGLDLALALD